MTWDELVAEVRAQIDVSSDQALEWLLDCARRMNANAGWLLREAEIALTVDVTEYATPTGAVRMEALTVGGRPYARSTLGAMDQARYGHGTKTIYADGVNEDGDALISIWPPASGTGILRFLADVPEPTNTATETPPFPADVHRGLSDGAIGIGLARMDERFDSAGYFSARFDDATARLRARRHSHVGRGGTPIRISS